MQSLSKLAVGALLLGLVLAAPTLPPPTPEALKGVDAVRAMEIANGWGLQRAKVQSFVTPEAVNFSFDGEKTVKIALPKDRMVIAIAPYLTYTHPCKTHYMSSCRGELTQTPVRVVAKTQDGKVIYQGINNTLENGFLELWLPRNLSLQVTLETQGRSATGPIATFNNSDTCVTTFQLR